MSEKPQVDESPVDAREMVAQADTGARNPTGIPAKMLLGVPLAWSLFQLWYASPLPFMLRFGVFNDTEARAIHLAFAIFLAFTAFPAFRRSPRSYIPIADWIFAFAGAWCASYLYLFYVDLSARSGAPTTLDLVTGCAGMLLQIPALVSPPPQVFESRFGPEAPAERNPFRAPRDCLDRLIFPRSFQGPGR